MSASAPLPHSPVRMYTHSPYSIPTHDRTPSDGLSSAIRRGAHGRTWSTASQSQLSIVSFDVSEDDYSRDVTPMDQNLPYVSHPDLGSSSAPPHLPPALAMLQGQLPHPDEIRSHVRRHSRQLSSGSNTSTGSRTHKRVNSTPYIFHTSLSGYLDFHHFPSAEALPQLIGEVPCGPETEHGLFFGQVKFEGTTELMTWLIQHLTNGEVNPVHIHPKGAGCFMAYFASDADVQRLQSFDGCLLFDDCGLWIAQSQKEFDYLHTYAAAMAPSLKGVRLPKGCMVIRK